MNNNSDHNPNNTKQLFFEINQKRLTQVQELLKPKQQLFLQVLPLLFHVNNQRLPGYIDDESPSGVFGYVPENTTFKAAKQLNRLFNYKRPTVKKQDIHTLLLMGSSGSIAQSMDSDLDIWCCHCPQLRQVEIDALQKKATAIEEWADSIKLEVHFFMMNAEKFKVGETTELSSESSGSAQHLLLLDEFYRTNLYIAGCYPLWWLVPPDEEKNYSNYILKLEKNRQINLDETIDLGGLESMPIEEFFGATVWQLNKALSSPYKSLLKISLIEAYAHDYPNSEWLSVTFKKRVYEGESDLLKLDPYLMLLEKLEQYIDECQADEQRQLLIRQCFYTKVNKKLSQKKYFNGSQWQLEKLEELIEQWHWQPQLVQMLDDRNQWKIGKVLTEHKTLGLALNQSYSRLSDFTRQYAKGSRINQQDLNILGRKLYVALSSERGKIEILNRGIYNDLSESHLSFQLVDKKWYLFQGKSTTNQMQSTSLKESVSLLELIAWAYLNNILVEGTSFNLNVQDDMMLNRELLAIIKGIQHFFNKKTRFKSTIEDLEKDRLITSSEVFINPGFDAIHDLDKLVRYNRVKRFGLFQEMIQQVEQVVKTSWKQVYTFSFKGGVCVLECLINYLNLLPMHSTIPPNVKSHCYSSSNATSLTQQVEIFFGDVLKWFSKKPLSQYVIEAENIYYVIKTTEKKDKVAYQYLSIRSFDQLLGLLEAPHAQFYETKINSRSLTETPLDIIHQMNKADRIQFFVHLRDIRTDLYILDELGTLIYCKINNANSIEMLLHYKQYIESCMSNKVRKKVSFHFYQLSKNYHGQIEAHEKSTPVNKYAAKLFNIKLSHFYKEDGELKWVININQCNFTSTKLSEGLFTMVAKHIIDHSDGTLEMSIYFSGADLPDSFFPKYNDNAVQAYHFLNFKKQIENQINLMIRKNTKH